jgi:uncharacterized protein YraI
MPRRVYSPVARSALITLALLTSLVVPPAASAAPTSVLEELNLRGGPGLGYRVLAVMPAGASVEVTGDPTEGWYPLLYAGLSGWGFGAYLGVGGVRAAAQATRAVAQDTATVVTSWLNLRRGPGLGYAIVAGLPYGTVVEILGGPQAADGYRWYRVGAGRFGSGFAVGDYLDPGEGGGGSLGGDLTPATPPPPPPPPPAPAPRASSGNAIVDLITEAAIAYGQSPAELLRVARCESNLDPSAYNPYSGASGLFQFLPGTWRTTPFAGHSIFDPWANANAAAWMWSVGRRGEWNC